MKYLIILVLSISITFLFAQYPNPYHLRCDGEKDGENCAVVIAISGLKIREKPSFTGKQLIIVPFGKKIQRLVTKDEPNKIIYTNDSIPGNWERVRYGKVEGFAFNAFFAEGIMKINEKYELLKEGEGWCWNDCYGSTTEKYNYYAVLKENKKSILTKFIPTFVGADGGVSIICPDKKTSEFIIVTKEEITEGPLEVIEKQKIIKGYGDYNSPKINQKVTIPQNNWILEVKSTPKKEGDYEYIFNELFLSDSKTGIKQKLNTKMMNCVSAELIWCGDLDRDGIMDFMVKMSDGDNSNGLFLFMSRYAPEGKLVIPAGEYHYGNCC
jgi:hypothetical protein